MRLVLFLTLAHLAPATAVLAKDCSTAEGAMRAAQLALDECGQIGLGPCAAEREALAAAQSAHERCLAGEPELLLPQLRPAFEGTVALVVQAAPDEEALLVQAGAQLALSGMNVIDSGAVRAAQAFLSADSTPES